MKRIKSVLCLILGIVIVLGAAGCVNKRTDVVKVNDEHISAAMFAFQLQQQKTNYLSENSLTESDDLWDSEYDEETTIGQQLQLAVTETFVTTCLWRDQFKKLELSFSDEEQKRIDDSIAEMEENYGGKNALEKILEEYDITYDEYIQSVYYDTQKILKVADYYYGENGLEPVQAPDILAYFKDNYVRVKHILISTLDDDGVTVTGDDMVKAKKTAQSVYEKAQKANAAAFEKLIEKYNEDEGVAANPNGYLFTTGEMVSEFENAAFDMKVGETRLVQSEYGFHIIRKLDLEDKDVYTDQVRQNLLLQIKTADLQKMLNSWREEAEIKINKSVLSKYNCNTVPTTTETETSQKDQVDQIAGQLGLSDEDKVK